MDLVFRAVFVFAFIYFLTRVMGHPEEVTLRLGEEDVAALVSPADAFAAIEACCERMARGAVEILPRERLTAGDGRLAVMAATDGELGLAAVKSYVASAQGARFA